MTIRTRLRAWLGIVDPPPPLEAVEREGITIASALLRRAGERSPAKKLSAPVLPPGVVPVIAPTDDPGALGPYIALDSAEFAPVNSPSFSCGLSFPGYAYLAELSQRSEYRAPSETIAAESTREWIKFVVKGEAETNIGGKLEELREAFEFFRVRESFRKIAELDGLFGRAQLFIDIKHDGREMEQARQLPLVVDERTIPKGSLQQLKVIEPMWTTPFTFDAADPLSRDFYVPRAWYVMGRRVHATRLLTFVSREVPDMLKPSYNFGGLSMTQLMEPDVFQWLRTRNSVSDLVRNFSVMCLATNMANVLNGSDDGSDVNGGAGLLARVNLFVANRDNQGAFLLDKDTEEVSAVNVPLSGLDKLQAQAQEHQAAPSHIPLVKLLGITPTGLNASSEGEIKVFYDFVRAYQQAFFADHLRTVMQVMQLHLFGAVDDAIDFEFVSLSSPTVKELADIRRADAETGKAYVDMGAISPEEVREKVNSDPESGYDNLSGPAPEAVETEERPAEDEWREGDHPRDKDGEFSSIRKIGGVTVKAGQTATGNSDHLVGLMERLSHEKERLRADPENKLRQAWVRQIEKEITQEREFLGMNNDPLPEISEEDLLRELGL